MNLNDLLTRLQAKHHHDTQGYIAVTAAMKEIEHGLAALAAKGHIFHLEHGPAYEIPEWPRILFHVTSAPNGRVVQSSWEALDLGPGWWPTLQEAQYKEGIRAQFRGRGGVGDRSLPMLVDGGPAGPRPGLDLPSTPHDNGSIIEEFKARIRSERSESDVRNESAKANDTTSRVGGVEKDHREDSRQRPGETEAGEGSLRVNGGWSEAARRLGAALDVQLHADPESDTLADHDVSGEPESGGRRLDYPGDTGGSGMGDDSASERDTTASEIAGGPVNPPEGAHPEVPSRAE